MLIFYPYNNYDASIFTLYFVGIFTPGGKQMYLVNDDVSSWIHNGEYTKLCEYFLDEIDKLKKQVACVHLYKINEGNKYICIYCDAIKFEDLRLEESE